MGIGRNLMRPEPFSLNVDKRPRYEYHAYHVTYELDLLLDLLDRKKPQVIVNFAAQGEGAVSWKKSWRFYETKAGIAQNQPYPIESSASSQAAFASGISSSYYLAGGSFPEPPALSKVPVP